MAEPVCRCGHTPEQHRFYRGEHWECQHSWMPEGGFSRRWCNCRRYAATKEPDVG